MKVSLPLLLCGLFILIQFRVFLSGLCEGTEIIIKSKERWRPEKCLDVAEVGQAGGERDGDAQVVLGGQMFWLNDLSGV